MNIKKKLFFGIVIALAVCGLLAVLLHGANFELLNPKGSIAEKQRNLMILASLLSLIVVVPVFVLLFFIVWRYRETNPRKTTYKPDWDHNIVLETIWWLVPAALIVVLAVVTWRSSHELDPYQPIASNKKTITIQVVALDWKWLFIYPDQHIATVNYVEFPAHTPVDFEITADAPMNSFWIPQLGGQIYAMSGMSTHLNLMADTVGSYHGSSANISGDGFAGMKFSANAVSDATYSSWLHTTADASHKLDWSSYQSLVKPSEYNPTADYQLKDKQLYDKIVMKYMPVHTIDTHARNESNTQMNMGTH